MEESLIIKEPYKVPVLLILFDRLNTVKQVFSIVRQIKPLYFFVAADGARGAVSGEKERCELVKKYIMENIDWNCKARTFFSAENHGAGKGVSGAITWFFSQVERGIILEHDCVPSLSFFPYCEALLERYKDNDNIWYITGNNPLTYTKLNYGYYFARHGGGWGWATWKRAWDKYSFDIQGLSDFIKEKKINKIFKNPFDRRYWLNIFRMMETHKIDTWDYQFAYTILSNNGMIIISAKNQISNIGFGKDAINTKNVKSIHNNQKRYELTSINHPQKIEVDNRLVRKINRVGFNTERVVIMNSSIMNMLRKIKILRKIKTIITPPPPPYKRRINELYAVVKTYRQIPVIVYRDAA